jgi:hypothetical protein
MTPILGIMASQISGKLSSLYSIASTTGGSANFSSIPQTYQDLYVVSQLRGVNANTIEYFFGNLNSSSSAIYSYTSLQGDGASASSSRTNLGNTAFFYGVGPGANSTANVFGSLQMWILNYASTSTFKTVLFRFVADQNGSGETRLGVGLFSSTAAINALNIFGGNGTSSSATHNLYGIKAGS